MTGSDLLELRRSPLAGSAFGLESAALTMREEPFRSLVEVRGDRPRAGDHVWGLGPDWWLVDGPPPAAAALEAPLAAELGGVDVAGQRTTLALTGEHALTVLAHGCPVDLEAVAVGGAVQGVLAGCQVVLGRVSEDGWRCYVRASYARHLAAWLTDAATPYV